MNLFYLSLQLVFFWSYSTDLSFLPSFFLFVCLSNACRNCLTLYLLLFHFSKSSSFFALRSESSWCRVCLNCKQTRASTLCVWQPFPLDYTEFPKGLEEEVRIISVLFHCEILVILPSILMTCLIPLFLKQLFSLHREPCILKERVSHNTWKSNKKPWYNGSGRKVVLHSLFLFVCLHFLFCFLFYFFLS